MPPTPCLASLVQAQWIAVYGIAMVQGKHYAAEGAREIKHRTGFILPALNSLSMGPNMCRVPVVLPWYPKTRQQVIKATQVAGSV